MARQEKGTDKTRKGDIVDYSSLIIAFKRQETALVLAFAASRHPE
jgi:hypothetical protein